MDSIIPRRVLTDEHKGGPAGVAEFSPGSLEAVCVFFRPFGACSSLASYPPPMGWAVFFRRPSTALRAGFRGCCPVANFPCHCLHLPLQKNVRSDHSHSGCQIPSNSGLLSAPWLSDVPGCPSLTWGGCGGREFPRTGASLHPGPTFARLHELKSSVKVVRHNWKIICCGKLLGGVVNPTQPQKRG